MIALIRHAEVEGGAGRCLGRTDAPLSDRGRAQALRLARSLGRIGWAALASSPLLRARETLAPLAVLLGRAPATLPELAEIDMGAWDGRDLAELRREHPEDWAARGRDFAGFRPPGGETFAEVLARARRGVERLAAGPRPCLAATHAGVLRALACHLAGQPLQRLFDHAFDHLGALLLRPGADGWEVLGENLAPEDLVDALLTR
ncbi:MAG: histidine phosphatase family protein [Desulfovibrionaceae bacterium]